MDFDLDLEQLKNAKSTIKDTNNDALDKVIDNARYPSEMKQKSDAFLTLPGRKVQKSTIQIDPKKTRLWSGNPRNFALVITIDDLLPKIKKSKGNLQPVLARKLDVADENGCTIEVIFGCRRRLSCIEANVLLTADIVDVDDSEAKYLANEENEGRLDNDFIADCRYLKSEYDRLKIVNGGKLSVEDFASMNEQARQTMSDKLHIADLPVLLLSSVKDSYSWTYRKGNRVKSLFNKLDASADKEAALEKISQNCFPDVDSLLNYLNEICGTKKSAIETCYEVGDSRVIVKKTSKTTKFSIPSSVGDALIDELEKVLTKYSSK